MGNRKYGLIHRYIQIQVAARSKTSISSSSFAGIVGSNPSRGHGCLSHVNDVCCKSGGLCDGRIPHPEENYRMCLYVCVLLSVIRRNNRPAYAQ
jgi:hypothetical protein